MKSVVLILALFVGELLLTEAQVTITAGAVATGLAAAGLGAAALGGLGLLAAAGSRRRGARRRGRKRHGRDVTGDNDDVTLGLVDLAAVQDASECAQKFICLLAAADSLSAMESDILEATKLKGSDTPKIFTNALKSGLERGAADCNAAYRGCPQTRSQLTRFVNDVMTFTAAQNA